MEREEEKKAVISRKGWMMDKGYNFFFSFLLSNAGRSGVCLCSTD